MNKKVPITRPIHPKFLIQHALSSVVRDLYDISWNPRVVRQKKAISVGSNLTYLDYAVPCFELSRLTSLPPEEITAEIVKTLTVKLNLKPDSEYFKYLKFEAIGGYVNLALEETYMRTATDNAVAWFQNPEMLIKANPTEILIIGYDITDMAALKTVYEAVRDFLDLNIILNFEQKFTYIFPDTSQQTITKLVEIVASEDVANSQNHKLALYRQIRHSFTGVESADFAKKMYSLIEKNLLNNSVFKMLSELKGGEVVRQSSLTSQVDEFLDTSFKEQAKKTDKIIFDEANKALYYTNPSLENVIPLRSAEGYIYNAAYHIFSLQSAMTELWGTDKKLVILAPHAYHVLMRDLTQINPSKNNPDIIFFDPQVSKADIEEVNKLFPNLKPLFKQISMRLKSTLDSDLRDLKLRQDVLLLVDFPMDASLYITESQLPALFDLLNQISQVLTTEQA